jgi:hypothetical protein
LLSYKYSTRIKARAGLYAVSEFINNWNVLKYYTEMFNIKFHKNSLRGSPVFKDEQKDGQARTYFLLATC